MVQHKRIAMLNGQFISLSKRVRRCPAAAADLRAATKMRKKALRGASRASAVRLRAKKRTMSRSVLRLSRAAKRCALSQGATRVIAMPGASGGAGGDGSSATLRVPDVVGGATVDFSQALGGRVLPPLGAVVEVGELEGSRCNSGTTVCVGIDTVALSRAVDALLDLSVSIPGLLDVDVGVLRSEVDRAIANGDLSSLLSVERLGDRALRLVPRGPLARLAGLGRLPNDVIGRVVAPG